MSSNVSTRWMVVCGVVIVVVVVVMQFGGVAFDALKRMHGH